MPDDDMRGGAWIVPPSAYLARRPAEHARAAPFSEYVTMPDGCRLAVDVHLPGGDAGRAWPVIAVFTPYYRRFALRPGAAGTEPSPGIARYRDTFVPRGYALVVVDVRGTGASFGTRDGFRSARERADYAVVADWIVAQPWSDGRIGATGISYLGAASDFLASTGHPAVRAIAPLFAVWDTWGDNYYPGGILLKELARVYDELMVALDHDRRDLLGQFAYFRDPNLAGPCPVDADADGALCRAAVAEHIANFRQPDFMAEFRCKDDTLPYDRSVSPAAFSPFGYAEKVRPDVAVYSVSGYMDGAGYANGAISRFLSLPNANRYLLLGPWDHGARVNVSPWRDAVEPRFDVFAEVLRFFDEHLAGRDTGLRAEARVHYFTLHEEAWHAAPDWPPAPEGRCLYLDAGGALAAAPGAAGADAHQADFSLGTGRQTRYERIAGIDTRDYYTDWQDRQARLPCYDSDPLPDDLDCAGHCVLDLWLASSEPDAAVFAYLSEVEADGAVRYVTEGLLRALHRAEAPCPPRHRTTWPYRTFARADAAPMPPGVPQRLRFALLPVSWRFGRGSRIRLSLAGADADHCGQIPHGRPPVLSVQRGGGMASCLRLPVRTASGSRP